MIIDLTQVEEAFGSSTTYFGGILVVDGNNIVVDGWTDRSTTPSDHAFNMLTEEAGNDFDFSDEFSDESMEEMEETWNQEISCGYKYDVTLKPSGLTIKTIPDTTGTMQIGITPQILNQIGLAIENGHKEDEQRTMWGDETVDWINTAMQHTEFQEWIKQQKDQQ